MSIARIKEILKEQNISKGYKNELNTLLDELFSRYSVKEIRIGDVFMISCLGHPFMVAKETSGGNYICIGLTSNAEYEFKVGQVDSRIFDTRVEASYFTTTLSTASPKLIKKNFMYHYDNKERVQTIYNKILDLITT